MSRHGLPFEKGKKTTFKIYIFLIVRSYVVCTEL